MVRPPRCKTCVEIMVVRTSLWSPVAVSRPPLPDNPCQHGADVPPAGSGLARPFWRKWRGSHRWGSRSLPRVEQFHPTVSKVFQVACDLSQIVHLSGCGYQAVDGGHLLASPLPSRHQFAPSDHDLDVQREDAPLETRDQISDQPGAQVLLARRIFQPLDIVLGFSYCQDAEIQGIFIGLGESAHQPLLRLATGELREDTGIQQVVHCNSTLRGRL